MPRICCEGTADTIPNHRDERASHTRRVFVVRAMVTVGGNVCFGVVDNSNLVDKRGYACTIVSVHVCSGTVGVAVEGHAFCSSSRFVDIVVVAVWI